MRSTLGKACRLVAAQATESSLNSSSSRLRLAGRSFATSYSSFNDAEASASSSSSTSQPPTEATTATSVTPAAASAKISVALLLSRQPLILRSPTPLESTYFDYNQTLARRLAQPFNKDFYFRKGSAGEVKFDEEEAQRKKRFDDVIRQAKQSSSSKQRQQQEQQEAGAPDGNEVARGKATAGEAEADLYATAPRRTEADEKGDVKSLERALDRTLFLMFRQQGSQWRLPTRLVNRNEKETLHRVAAEPVTSALGKGLDIWMISNMPVGMMPRPSTLTGKGPLDKVS